MARLVARWRRSDLVILVTFKKRNHLGEAYVKRDRRKDLYRAESDTLEGPHEEAEMQRKTLRRGKNLAFSEDTCLEKERVRSKTPVLRPALQSKQSSLCGLRLNGDRVGGGPNGQIVSVKSAADRRRQRSREIIDEKREKYRTKNGSLLNTLTGWKATTFVILINHTSAPIRKKRLRVQRAKQRGRPAKMSLWKNAGYQTESKASEKSIVGRIV